MRATDTTAGSSLARLTIVDENGTAVLDELVRQHVPILDANTRFSGVTTTQLKDAVMDIHAVRAAALMFIGPDTVLVGHGLVKMFSSEALAIQTDTHVVSKTI